MARSPHRPDVCPQHLTGFDEEVKLGQLGEILENDSVVMSVELFDESAASGSRRRGEPLWRGVTMASYENGPLAPAAPASHELPVAADAIRRLAQGSSASRSGSSRPTRPSSSASGPCSTPRPPRAIIDPDLNAIDGTIIRADPRTETYRLPRRSSDTDPDRPQPGERLPRAARETALLLEIPKRCASRLRAIAERQVIEIFPPSSDAPAGPGPWSNTSGAREFSLLRSTSSVDRSHDRPGPRLPGQSQVRALRVLRQRPDAAAPLGRTSPPGWSTASRGATGTTWRRSSERAAEARP